MSDQDFNFRPPERREAKQFEPPPWEQDAFEGLAQNRGEGHEAEAAAEAPKPLGAIVPEVVPEAELASEPEPEPEAAPTAGQGPDAKAEEPPAVSEAQMLEMMAALRAEEPRATESYSKLSLWLSALTGALGVVMLFWAMAMLVSASARGTGRVGVLGGLIVGIFGALFIGLAMWVGVRALRDRGVL